MSNSSSTSSLISLIDIELCIDDNNINRCNNEKSLKNNKTKKNRNINNSNKKHLWLEFDTQVKKKENSLECIDENFSEEFCEKCDSALLTSDEGFLTCTNSRCGIIYKNAIDYGCEWRFYGAEDNNSSDPSRVGMPVNELLKESSYGCKLLCNGKTSYEMQKIKRYINWQSTPYKEKTQYDQFQTIRTIAQNSGIPLVIINDAIMYHKKIMEYDQSFRGDNKDGLIAASVYISCRANNYQRTSKEIAVMFNLDSSSTSKGCKIAQSILNQIEKNTNNEEKIQFTKTTPESFIERYCSKLNINAELSNLCKFICIIIDKNKMLPQNAPHSIASGIVYYIAQLCCLNISKTDIRNVSEISEVTINKCYRNLLLIDKNMLIPNEIQKKYNII